MTQLDHTQYMYLVGKKYWGRYPDGRCDGRIITVEDVRFSVLFHTGVAIYVEESTGHRWVTSQADRVAEEIGKYEEAA